MGECPDWYPLISASKYLGVAPWDLLAQGIGWTHLARAHEEVVMELRKDIEEAAARKNGM